MKAIDCQGPAALEHIIGRGDGLLTAHNSCRRFLFIIDVQGGLPDHGQAPRVCSRTDLLD